MLALYFYYPSSNPAEVYSYYCVKIVSKNEKESWNGPFRCKISFTASKWRSNKPKELTLPDLVTLPTFISAADIRKMVSVKRREIEPRPTRQRPVWPDWAFLNILATKFPAKMPQKFAKHFGLFWKMAFLNKNCGGYLFSNFWWKLGYFLLQHLVTLGPPNTAAKSFPFSTKNCKTECLLTVSERAKGENYCHLLWTESR